MKNGLIFENEELIYYKNDKPYHAGAIKVDEDIYYIGSHGRAAKGRHIVHREMTNGLLERGTYTFGDDYKLIKGSFIPPKKRKKRKKKLSKQQQKVISLSVAAVLLIFAGILMTTKIKHPDPSTKAKKNQNQMLSEVETTEPEETTAPAVLFSVPEIKDPVLSSGSAMLLYQGQVSVQTAVEEGDPYRPLVFNYNLVGTDGILYISETANFYKADEYVLLDTASSVTIHNLKIGTKYYWKAVAGDQIHQGEFTTAKTTRFVKMEGVKNTRDIGGYVTQDGKTIKQGMIIRGTEIDALEAVGNNYFLDSNCVEQVQKTFGFVYDMDLRYSDVYSGNNPYQSRLGEQVRHKFYSAPQYGQIFQKNYETAVRNIFTDLANPDNYPMYLHCAYGADRTGTIVFLLMGVLNMSEEEMLREYHRTGFTSKTYAENTKMDVVIEGLRRDYAGDTLQEQIISYLLSKGVTQEQLDSIREILLTE